MTAVLFDLDGTLADTAPDLAQALCRLMADEGLPHPEYALLRPFASGGARGLIAAGLGISHTHARFPDLRERFLTHYEAVMLERAGLFDGVPELLAAITQASVPWGIVTNKATRYAVPVTKHVGLAPPLDCLVCGDTTPYAKPHPAPLLEAASRLKVDPGHCVYVGDDRRDIQAARAAGMRAIAAAYGYLGEAPVDEWDADDVIQTPLELLKILDLA
ncbi:MAG: HAD-IA family hydrolase [Betaproteobacteria bacterium]|nr:HAD-IA family hydrolase [Betaproteobacteria bacterium]